VSFKTAENQLTVSVQTIGMTESREVRLTFSDTQVSFVLFNLASRLTSWLTGEMEAENH